MGWGDFGSDGSVHWQVVYNDTTGKVNHSDDDDFKKHPGKPGAGEDPRPPIGDGKAGSGRLRVTARYKNHGDAKQALADANAKLQPGDTVIVLDVDIRNYRPEPPNPKDRSEWEVSVDW